MYGFEALNLWKIQFQKCIDVRENYLGNYYDWVTFLKKFQNNPRTKNE